MHAGKVRQILQAKVQRLRKPLGLNHRLVGRTELFGEPQKAGNDSSHWIGHGDKLCLFGVGIKSF
jgi:hypothetical protein